MEKRPKNKTAKKAPRKQRLSSIIYMARSLKDRDQALFFLMPVLS
jgi:hypothetical protein